MVRLAVAALLLGTLGIVAPADGSPGNMQQRIAAAIEATPGGVQVSWNEVSWNNGDVVLTLAPETGEPTAAGETAPAAAVGSCANDRHCVYSLPGLAGNKLTFTTCTSQGVGPLGAPVKSVANARTGVTVTAKNGTAVVLTVGGNSWANTSAAITTVSC